MRLRDVQPFTRSQLVAIDAYLDRINAKPELTDDDRIGLAQCQRALRLSLIRARMDSLRLKVIDGGRP